MVYIFILFYILRVFGNVLVFVNWEDWEFNKLVKFYRIFDDECVNYDC